MLRRTILLMIMALSFTVSVYAQSEQPVVYVCFKRESRLNGDLIILNAMTLTEIGRIRLNGIDPYTIALRPDKRIAFIGSDPRFTAGMLVVDLVEKRVIKTMFQDNRVNNLQIGPDGFVYAALASTQQIGLINSQTFELERTIQLPKTPFSITFSPDGNRAYVVAAIIGSPFGDDLLVIDLNTHSIIKTIAGLPRGGGEGERPAISPDGQFLYIPREGLIAVVDTENLIMLEPLPGTDFTNSLQISRDGRTLYAADFGLAVSNFPFFIAIDIPSRKTIKDLSSVGFSRFTTTSPDGQLVYCNDIDGFISVIDTKTNTLLATFQKYVSDIRGFGEGIAVAGDFSVGSPPKVQVLSPKPGEIVQRGKPFTFRWQTAGGDFNLGKHQLELSADGGQTFNFLSLSDDLSATAQEFVFNVPVREMQNLQIRVTAIDIGGKRDSALSGLFSIGDRPPDPVDQLPPTVNFISPSGGEIFSSGDAISISWVSSDNVGVTSQSLTLSTDGGSSFPIAIASSLGGSVQSFAYKIPNELATERGRFRLAVRDAAGNSAQAVTAMDFQIKPPLPPPDTTAPIIAISKPMNDVITAGQPIAVNWKSTDNVAVVSQSLLLSLDGGASFQTIANFGADGVSFTITNAANIDKTTPRAQVKITATDAAGNRGEKTASFTIAPAITQAASAKPNLTINGIGFVSNNAQASVRLIINGREAAAAKLTVNGNTSITAKGNKKKLNLAKGANAVQVIVDGVSSNTTNFQF